MSNLTQLDIDAGYATVTAMETHTEFLSTMLATLNTNMENLVATWHGNSKTQFDQTWSEYTSAVTQVKQTLQDIRDNLRYEVQSVEEVFSA